MRPPARWLSAATHCSRPPSKLCAGSACAPGASARSPPPPSFCSTTSMAEPHDHRPDVAATGNSSVNYTDRDEDVGRYYEADAVTSHSAIQVVIPGDESNTHRAVVVRWRNQPDAPERTWRYPIPPFT